VNVLAAGGDDDVAHPVGDPYEAVRVHDPDVAVCNSVDDRLRGLLGFL